MGAGASIETDEAKQREQCDGLFDKIDKMNNGKLNYMELKKGFEELESESDITMSMDIKKFLATGDANSDKVLDKEEFYTIMKKVLEDGNLEKGAAVKIQAIARGKKDRAVVAEKKEQKDAAVKIQAISRGKTDRKAVEEKKEQVGAATKIQAISRGKSDRKAVEEKKEQVAAATKIQAISRGQSARKMQLGEGGADPTSRVKGCFDGFDVDGNGFLTLSEVKTFLGEAASAFVAEMDKIQKDDRVQWEEWEKYFTGLSDDERTATLTELEGIIASTDLSKAAPPAGEETTAQ